MKPKRNRKSQIDVSESWTRRRSAKSSLWSTDRVHHVHQPVDLTYRIQSIIKFFVGHGLLKCQSKSRLRRNCNTKDEACETFLRCEFVQLPIYVEEVACASISNALLLSKLPRSLTFAPDGKSGWKRQHKSPHLSWSKPNSLVARGPFGTSKRKHCIQNNSVSWIQAR